MDIRSELKKGLVIPAHPLALTADRQMDERRQRALTRYYLASGAGGIAVGVHTTQFAIRDPEVGLYKPVLELAAEEAKGKEIVKIAGAVGPTTQATREAGIARDLGYDAVLLSLGALKDASVRDLITHVRAVAQILPVFGFYLQPSVGGRILPYAFWRDVRRRGECGRDQDGAVQSLSNHRCCASRSRIRTRYQSVHRQR